MPAVLPKLLTVASRADFLPPSRVSPSNGEDALWRFAARPRVAAIGRLRKKELEKERDISMKHLTLLKIGVVAMSLFVHHTAAVSQYSNPTAVDLATAGNLRALAGTTVTVGAACTVTGDVGGTSVVNNGTVDGTIYQEGTTVTAALTDLTAAIADASARTPDDATLAVELSGLILGRGVYAGPGTFGINGTLTLNGTASDVFIFKTTTTLITGVSCVVNLTGGAVATNVFWQVGSSATIDGDFKGIILATTSITQNTGSIDGRALARDGGVTVSGSSVLPVQLTTFTATANQMNAVLQWSTATELNNYGFEIERRQSGPWANVGFVPGAGTSSAPREYSYSDNNLIPGRYAYRIKQVDMNGMFSYYGAAEVEIGSAEKTFELESNYPNPFNPSTTIRFTLANDGAALLRVYNMLGQSVMTLFEGNAEAGKMYQVTFDASGLPSGFYVAHLRSGNNQMIRKMLLMR
ncbi:MAG: ice-binding family protein [Bacteroidota bacterium]